MKEEIEQYEPMEPSLVAVGVQRVRAFVGDHRARLGDVLWVGDEPTRIVALAGNRRVEAIAFDTSSMSVGDSVRVGEQVAGWPTPREGATPLAKLSFAPGRTPTPEAASCEPAAMEFGLGDTLPIVQDGVTLLLDTGAADARFDELYTQVRRAAGDLVAVGERTIDATRQVVGSNGLALMVAARWASELGDTLVVEAPPFDLDELLDTITCRTVVVRVLLDGGLEILAESLDLGYCDTQMLIRPDGSIDLVRSNSRLTDVSERFNRLGAVREQLAIFGEHELDETDRRLLTDAEAIETGWF